MTKHHLPLLEFTVEYGCTLKCRGCISLTDQHGEQGSVTLDTANEWMTTWSNLLTVDTLVITGGEPLLNPDILEIVRSARTHWPDTHIQLVTNGEHFDTVDPLPVLLEIGNSTLWVSCHWNIGPYFDQLQKRFHAVANANGTWVSHHPEIANGVYLDMRQGTTKITMAVYGEFIKTYHGTGASMRPWRSKDPAMAHAYCGSPNNPQLYNNRLYKCSPIANLKKVLIKHQLDKVGPWQDYLAYKGYGPEDNLEEFVQDIGQPNAKICTMCSDNKQVAQVPHYDIGNVVFRNV